MVLNEMSCAQTAATQAEAGSLMRQLVDVCRAVWQRDRGATLASEIPMDGLEIAPGYSVAKWRNEPRNRDAALFLRRTLMSKSPLSKVLPEPSVDECVEYRFQGEPVLGLAAAHLMDALAVSLASAPCWSESWLSADFESVDQVDGYAKGTAAIRHAACVDHVMEHCPWIEEQVAAAALSPRSLWDQRGDLFPHLEFVAGVEENILDLQTVALRSVVQELRRLEAAAAAWIPGEAEPRWLSKVVPESESRINLGLCHFPDDLEDGNRRLFSLHCRFQPSPGRIHLRLITAEAKIRIGYVGRKRLEDGVPKRAR